MKLIKRDPNFGYIDSNLWVPKALLNVEGVKSALEFEFPERNTIRVLKLWEEAEHHLIVPRAFWKPEDLPFPCIDCRPRYFTRTQVTSNIRLDLKPGPGGVLQPTGKDTQKRSIDALLKANGGTLQLACGLGKAQPKYEQVLTPGGWMPLSTLQVGDSVIGKDGNPTEVLGIFPQGKLPIYKVTFDDGASTKCCAEHLWETQTPNDRKYGRAGAVRTTEEIRSTLRTTAGLQHSIPRCDPVHFEEAEPVFEPWLIGFYLGDGSSGVYNGHRRICFDKGDTSIHQSLREILGKYNLRTTQSKDKRSKNITTNVTTSGNANRLWDVLEAYHLTGRKAGAKFIPWHYLHATIPERRALLQGLLDSDGAKSGTGWEYSTKSERLAEDIRELVESLGGRAVCRARIPTYTYKGKKLKGAISHRLYITMQNGRYIRRYIKSIVRCGEAECLCIKVAADDQLYITSRYIVTHNTVVALHFSSILHVPTLIAVDNTHLLHQWRTEIAKHLDVPGGVGLIQGPTKDWRKSIVMATYHTLANWSETMPEEVRRWFGLIIWDEGHHVNAPTFSKSAPLFYGYRLALTATPDRNDGTHVICQHHVGDIIFKDIIQNHPPKISFKWTGYTLDMLDTSVRVDVCDKNGELHLGKVAGHFGANKDRLTTVVLPEVQRLVDLGHKVLVLSYSVDEVINLMTLWSTQDPNAPLYTDIPYPTQQDVNAPIPPAMLHPSYIKQLEHKIGEIETNLKRSSLTVDKRRSFQDRLNRYKLMLTQHEVWRKTEKLYRKRQREYLAKLLAMKSTSGLFTEAVAPAERFKMLRERQVIFAIMKYGKEGLDDKKLSAIVVSEPMSDRNTLQQIMGRPRDKSNSELVFLEDNVGPLVGQCKKLRRHLRDWPMEEGGPFRYTLIDHPATHRRQGTTTWNQASRTQQQWKLPKGLRIPGSP